MIIKRYRVVLIGKWLKSKNVSVIIQIDNKGKYNVANSRGKNPPEDFYSMAKGTSTALKRSFTKSINRKIERKSFEINCK